MLYYYNRDDSVAGANYVTLAQNDRVVVTNNAHIQATGTGHVVQMATYGRIDVSGLLVADSSAIFGNLTSNTANVVRVLQGGAVISGNDYAITLLGNSNEVSNAGTISGQNGVNLGGNDERLVNKGDISGYGTAVYLGTTASTIGSFANNSGTIDSANGDGIYLKGTATAVSTVINSGQIDSDANGINVLGCTLHLTNTGVIHGGTHSIYGDVGADTVVNTGTLIGTVDLFSGDDSYDGTGGRVDGIVLGNNGDDVLTGGAGRDQLNGGNDNDLINGGAGDDVLNGGYGLDRIDGGDGRDTLTFIGDGAVTIDLDNADLNTGAASGKDVISIEIYQGSESSDQLFGTAAGNDVLYGYDGDDIITGRDGNDVLIGQVGNDLLIGGRGNDRMTGGDGIDTASYADAGSLVKVSLAITGAQNTLGAGTDTLATIENLIGSGYDDQLTGNTSANVLIGGAGKDTLVGGDGDDTLNGGAGDDILTGGVGFDTVDYSDATAAVMVNLATLTAQATGGSGSDTLTGIEALIGSAYNDQLRGDAGNNTIEGGAGNDYINGYAGIDTVSYLHATAGVTVDLTVASNVSQNTIGAGTDSINNMENIIGSHFDDTLTGNGLDNRIDGGDGNNMLNGGAGNDVLSTGSGNSTINGWDGIDTLTYAGNQYYGMQINLFTSNPYATDLYHGYFEYEHDTLTSVETFVGSKFADEFDAGTTVTTFTGGLGADKFVFNAGTAQGDTITDFSGAPGQGDTLTFTGYGADAAFSQVDATHFQIHSNMSGLTEVITFTNAPTIHIATDVIITP